MIDTSRRGFVFGAGATLAVVPAGILMPVRTMAATLPRPAVFELISGLALGLPSFVMSGAGVFTVSYNYRDTTDAVERTRWKRVTKMCALDPRGPPRRLLLERSDVITLSGRAPT